MDLLRYIRMGTSVYRSAFGILLVGAVCVWLDSSVMAQALEDVVAADSTSAAIDGVKQEPAVRLAEDQISQAEWQDEYRRFSELLKRYEDAAKVYGQDVKAQIHQRYQDEMSRIQDTYDSRYEELDEELSVRRAEAIASFSRFIEKHPRSVHTPMAIFRLAELYYDQSSYDFIQAQIEYDQLLEEMDLSNTKALPPDPRYDFRQSLELYGRIIEEFPGFKHIDGVYYMRGYLLGNDLARQYYPERAKNAWIALIEHSPDSMYASQAYLRIGEYYFERGGDTDLHSAIDYYQRVMSYQDKWYDRALYKIAWSYYKLSDYTNAIARFFELIDFSEAQRQETGAESDLRTEAVEYLAISFADDGDVTKAIGYFDAIGDKPYKFEVLKMLADIYYKQAKFEESIATYRNLQVLFPYHEENPNFQYEIVNIYQRMPIPELEAALRAKEELIERYSPESIWAQKQGIQHASVTRAQELAQTMLKELAYYYHNLGEGASDPLERQQYYAEAAEKYREYLTKFPYSKDTYELQFFYSECLYFSQRFEEAADQYGKAMTSTEPKYHADAARGRVDSLMELVKRTEGDAGILKAFPERSRTGGDTEVLEGDAQQVVDVKNSEPVAISRLKKEYIAAIDVLARIAPASKDVPNFLFIAAQIYFYHNDYQDSQRRYQSLIDEYPAAPVAVVAAANLVDGLINQQHWVDVQRAVDRLVALRLGVDTKEWARVCDQLVEVGRQAKQKWAEELAANQNFEEAHQRFKESGTDAGLLNAAKIMDGLGNVEVTIGDYRELVRKFPHSEYVPFALYRTASNYEKLFDLEEAIKYYERLATEYPGYERAPDAINNAALLRIGMHQYDEAARAYERYSRQYQEQADAELLAFFAGVYFEKAGDKREAIRAYREYLRRYSRVDGDRHMSAYAAIVKGLDGLGRKREAYDMEKSAPSVLASLRDLPTFTASGVNLYAEIIFRGLERTMEEFQAVRLTGKMSVVAANLDKKNRLKDKLETQMAEIVRIADLEWSMAALYYVGLAYYSFAEALREAVPPDLSDDDRLIYMQTLEDDYIFKFEDRALEYFKRILKVESTQKVWNRWTEQTYVQLNRLRPDLYPARKQEEILFQPGEQTFEAPPITDLGGPELSLNIWPGLECCRLRA